MLWSLIKILLFVVAVGTASLFASYIADLQSDVHIVIDDTEYSPSPLTLAVMAILILPAFWLLFFLFGLTRASINFILGDETALSRYFNRNREQRGFEALADGLLALSSGEPKLALTKVQRAENLLNRPEVTGIIAAQAAERVGDKDKAVAAYKKMLHDDRTRFAGISGLLKHRIENDDMPTALKLAEKAFVINPQHDDVQNTLLRLQAGEEDWTGALRTLAVKFRQKKIPRDVYRRRRAILTYVSAMKKLQENDTHKEGEGEALSANKESPGLIPAAVLAANIKNRSGDRKAAESIIRRAWSVLPHPDLAATFAAFVPDETPVERKKRFQNMIGKNIRDPESMMLMAELSIADADFLTARHEIGTLPETQPTVRSLAIMAAIERGDGSNDAIVRGWLAKAVSANRGPQWLCNICGQVHAKWVPVCQGCDAFDSLEWRAVSEDPDLGETQAGLLSLAAGSTHLSTDLPEHAPLKTR